MPVEAVLIAGPTIDFGTLLSLTHQALGYNLAENADSSYRKMVDAEKYLSCLAALKHDEITPHLLSHVLFGVLVISEERSLMDILERTSGMSFIRADTTVPDVNIAILSGNLAQWRDAVASGTNEFAPPIVRTCYTKILLLFDHAGLTSFWSNYERKSAPDRSGYLLEYHHA